VDLSSSLGNGQPLIALRWGGAYTANDSQYATSHCKPLLFWFLCMWRYINVWASNRYDNRKSGVCIESAHNNTNAGRFRRWHWTRSQNCTQKRHIFQTPLDRSSSERGILPQTNKPCPRINFLLATHLHNKYECTIDPELAGAAARRRQLLCVYSPVGNTSLREMTSWPAKN